METTPEDEAKPLEAKPDGEKKGTAYLTDGSSIYYEIDVSATGEYLVLEEK